MSILNNLLILLQSRNGAFDPLDVARMHLASTRMADRYGNVFFGSIQPNEWIVQSSESDSVDPVLDRAIQWLDALDGIIKD